MPRKRSSIDWTEKAERDLEAIRSIIAKNKPIAADRFILRIKKAVENLKRFPSMGEILATDNESVIREIYVKSYRVVFRLRDDSIRVLTIVHGSRDFNPAQGDWRTIE